jgi:hypothetical protein
MLNFAISKEILNPGGQLVKLRQPELPLIEILKQFATV